MICMNDPANKDLVAIKSKYLKRMYFYKRIYLELPANKCGRRPFIISLLTNITKVRKPLLFNIIHVISQPNVCFLGF